MLPNLRPMLGKGAAALAAGALGLTMVACTTETEPTTPPPATAPADPATPEAGETTNGAETPGTDATPGDADERDVITEPPARSWQDALGAAQEAFPNGEPIKIELDREDDRLVYKLDLVTETEKFEAEFDAETLEQREANRSELGMNADSERQKVFNPEELVPMEQAVEAARGQEEGMVTGWTIEGQDDGQVHYEFDIEREGAPGGNDVTVDARSGEVVNN